MRKMSSIPAIDIGALDSSYPMYYKTMRILVREGLSLEQIQRSFCWNRLHNLHHVQPTSYCEPGELYSNLKREIGA